MKIRLFEAFAGIGSQAEALKELGIEFESVGISDIDKHAIAGYEAIHGPVKNYGDITKIEHLPECDLLTYSYPCTSVSLAGKREGMVEGSGTASSLLWEVGRLLKDMNDRNILPEILLMENVDAVLNRANKPEFDRWCLLLSDLGYVNSYTIMNAKDYGTPQNRKRIFMVSSLTQGEFVFPDPCPDGRVLRDVLEKDVPESFFLSEKRIATFKRHKERNDAKGNGFGFKIHELTDYDAERERGDVSASVTNSADRYCATWIGIPKSESQSETGIQITGKLTDYDFNQSGKVYDPNGVSSTIRTPSGGGVIPKIELNEVGTVEGKFDNDTRVYSEEGSGPTVRVATPPMIESSREKILWPDGSSKTGSAEAEIGDGVKIYPNPARENSGGTVQKGRTNALNTYPGGGSGTPVSDGERLRIRYLTPRECLRLQAFPDDAIDKLEKVLSKSALYKVAGNSIAVCCLKAIFKGIYIDKTFRSSRQANLDRWF